MGIDIYTEWDGMTEKDKKNQITGFSVVSGHLGYLREAFHGEPYVTKFLVPEAFASENGKAEIPVKFLKERLKLAIELAIKRNLKVYKTKSCENCQEIKTFKDFVNLCEEKEKKTGKPVTIIASY